MESTDCRGRMGTGNMESTDCSRTVSIYSMEGTDCSGRVSAGNMEGTDCSGRVSAGKMEDTDGIIYGTTTYVHRELQQKHIFTYDNHPFKTTILIETEYILQKYQPPKSS